MLFKALQVLRSCFFIALLADESGAQVRQDDTRPEIISPEAGPDSHPDGRRSLCRGPVGNIVGTTARGGFMVLDRDDRGGLNNTIIGTARRYRARYAGDGQIRGIVPGETP